MVKEVDWLISLIKPKDSVTLILSLLIYFIILFKVFEFFMHTPRKMTVKERNQKRFMGAHKEIIGTFSEQDHKLMDDTIKNTLVNAAKTKQQKRRLKKKYTRKSVKFEVEKNQFIDPIMQTDNDDQSDKHSLLKTATSLSDNHHQNPESQMSVQVR